MNTLPLRFLAFISVVVTIFINLLANLIPIGGRLTQDVSDAFYVLFVPAGYVFSIWGLIYIALIGFAIWQMHFKQEKHELYDRIAPTVIVASLANSLWIFLWHNLHIELSMFAMLVLLVSLIMIYMQIGMYEDKKDYQSMGFKVFVKGTFSLYLGWISVATIANVTNVLYLKMYNVTGRQLDIIPTLSVKPMLFGVQDEIWAVIMILVAGVLAGLMAYKFKDYVYSLVVVWALVGIYVKFQDITEIMLAVLVSVVFIMAVMVFRIIPAQTETKTVRSSSPKRKKSSRKKK